MRTLIVVVLKPDFGRRHLTVFIDIFGCHNWTGVGWGGWMFLASSGQRPGMLLIPYNAWTASHNRVFSSQVSVVLLFRKILV